MNMLKNILLTTLLFSVIFTGQRGFFSDLSCDCCGNKSTKHSCCYSPNSDDSGNKKACCVDKKTTHFDWTPALSLQFSTISSAPLVAIVPDIFNLYTYIPTDGVTFNDTSPPIHSPRKYLAFIQVLLI